MGEDPFSRLIWKQHLKISKTVTRDNVGVLQQGELYFLSAQCCLAVLCFLQGKGRRFAGRAPQVNYIRSQNHLGYLLSAPDSTLGISSFGWIYLCLSSFEGKVKSNNRKPTFHYTVQSSQGIEEAILTFLLSKDWRYFTSLLLRIQGLQLSTI